MGARRKTVKLTKSFSKFALLFIIVSSIFAKGSVNHNNVYPHYAYSVKESLSEHGWKITLYYVNKKYLGEFKEFQLTLNELLSDLGYIKCRSTQSDTSGEWQRYETVNGEKISNNIEFWYMGLGSSKISIINQLLWMKKKDDFFIGNFKEKEVDKLDFLLIKNMLEITCD